MEGFDPSVGVDGEHGEHHEEMQQAFPIMADDTAGAGSPLTPPGVPVAGTLGAAFAKAKFDAPLRWAICAALGGDESTDTEILGSLPQAEVADLVSELVLENGNHPTRLQKAKVFHLFASFKKEESSLTHVVSANSANADRRHGTGQ